MKRGFFIAFEGGEGAGKSTQIRKLRAYLERSGRRTVVTREPGGTALGKRLRWILLSLKSEGLHPRAELLLYEADRAHHVEKVIRPALAEGKVVLSDRFSDSSTVYQGYCRGLGVEWVDHLNQIATGGLRPDLVILLDVPNSERRKRLNRRGPLDRMEKAGEAFHRKVREGFLRLAKAERSRFVVIPATQTRNEIAAQIQSVVAKRFKVAAK